MYKIKAPSEEYDRKIGGVQFVVVRRRRITIGLQAGSPAVRLYRGNRDRRGGNRADRGQTEGEAQK